MPATYNLIIDYKLRPALGHFFAVEVAPVRTKMIYRLGNFYIIPLAHNSCKFELLPILTATRPKTLCYEQHSKLVDEG